MFSGLNHLQPLVQWFWKSFHIEFQSSTTFSFYSELLDIFVEKNNSAVKWYCLLLHIEKEKWYEMKFSMIILRSKVFPFVSFYFVSWEYWSHSYSVANRNALALTQVVSDDNKYSDAVFNLNFIAGEAHLALL